MYTCNLRTALKAAGRGTALALCAAALALGQTGQQVNLTAAPSNTTLSDGSTVPMWGYTCGAPVTGSTAICGPLNPTSTTGGSWSPVVITVPTGQSLTINLTNNLTFTPQGSTTANSIPTSIVIVGQLGGGLGAPGSITPSPAHTGQSNATWPSVSPPPKGGFQPPTQGARVQSFSKEVTAGQTVPLTWNTPRPGTYLIESGTHPSIQGPMGLYGILVVTAAPTAASSTATATAGVAYTAGSSQIKYDAEVPLLFSEIDPVQNNAVNAAVNTAGFSETMVWSGQPGGCGNPSSKTYNQCYPPAVNYTPLYYLINGRSFDKTNAGASLFATSPATLSSPAPTGIGNGQVLVRLVNAGLRMHVPAIVGAQTGANNVPGFALIAEDGNLLPGVPRIQNEVFMAAGKTYDVMISAPASGAPALPVYDRQLSLSGNATARDAGMLAYIGVNGGKVPSAPVLTGAVANPDTYNSVVPGSPLNISDISRGVIANDVNVNAVQVLTPPTKGTLILNANGTFSYTPNSGWTAPDTFTYQANGNKNITALVTLNAAPADSASNITANNLTFNAAAATYINVAPPGVLTGSSNSNGYALTAVMGTSQLPAGSQLIMQPNGGFIANVPGPGTYTFTYQAKSSGGAVSNPATVTLNFPNPTGLTVTVLDGQDHKTAISDYRWIIEEDRTFYVDPKNTTNTGTTGSTTVPTYGVNFHASWMPVVAQGCTGPNSCESGQTVFDPKAQKSVAAVCDAGNGVCHTDATQQIQVDPKQVHLDPAKRYYISVLPGDAANSFTPPGTGHGMGGAPISPGQTAVTVLAQPTPFPPGKLSVVVFEDDNPLNGEQDAGGGVDVLSPNEPGLGGFNIVLLDAAGASGDSTGQMTYDMFNNPLSNSLAGQKDPATNLDACPISQQSTKDPSQVGITGMIVTCPKYESDGKTLSPLAGQAVIANLMPGRFSVVATPGADRIARGEEWLQTNTLDGQKGHDAFIRIGEPPYFQEYGPAGYHVAIGFANPTLIKNRKPDVCTGVQATPGASCSNSITGMVTTMRTSRTPDERLFSSGSRDSFYFSQCYVSIGDPDGEDFDFTKCDANGKFSFTNIPDGSWRMTLFDQWNDQIVDGLSVPVAVKGKNVDLGEVPVQQWQANIYTRTFIDDNKDGVAQAKESGIPLIPVVVRYRDGSLSNTLNTDFSGVANFNEEFPLFNWYVVEADAIRYKTTGIHVVYDAGGPADGSSACQQQQKTGVVNPAKCGNSTIGKFLANTYETNPLPANLHVPGALYCDNADCNGTNSAAGVYNSTGRIDPGWVPSEGWQGFGGQNNFLEFGKIPYADNENGGIKGHVVYASTRPFDDPQMLVQAQWEPLVPHVTINLYQEGTAADGSQSLKLVDTTQTSSWDDWAQGFYPNTGKPYMSCPGQTTSDLFYFTLYNQPNFLNAGTALPNNSQYKCYDGMHNWNQLQPAPYDGMYAFPSVTSRDPNSGVPVGTNCSICGKNPTDGTPMLPTGKYVVEVVVPPGYELVKEEDKNILIGDGFIAPAVQQFGGNLSAIFVLPDQATIASTYNANNPQNPTANLGATPRNQEVPGFDVEPVWPCVGQARVVPDFISLFPGSSEVAPFAGATRNLCDRKEVTLDNQESVTAKFYIFTSTHIAAHFTGVITDDMTSEFDPFSPAFGEKFAPPDLPVSIKDWAGNEISRVYADHWGIFNGLNYSTWEVNPPNPTGYSPTMMITCMNDPGPIPGPNGTLITDPLYNSNYSNFCYELPFMPGRTVYMDTPVVPTSGFSEGYNHPDCDYPDATPAISSVIGGDGVAGPWVKAAGSTLTINALGDQIVNNYGYSGPSATKAPFNQKKITRHYGFGNTQGTGFVTIGGVKATVTSWSDTQIVVTVPGTGSKGIPACAIQQQTQYGGSTAYCGELAITASNGKQSVDTVTVTVGGKTPTVMAAGQTIQSAIDAAQPGDMIIVPPGTYNEMVLMWKPLRLQGVGAASSIVNANTHPAGKMDPWRRQAECLFGLSTNGRAITASNPYDATSTYTCSSAMQFQVDRLPLEAVIGWDTTLNGNLAELLQEPTLLGAYEGAGITVLGKGVNFHGGDPFANDTFPTGTTLLTKADCGPSNGPNPFPSNFWCNPSRVDGLSVVNSSQGGGGIFAHAWNHNLEVSNNRVYNNAGTLAGGISIGQGEFPPAYLVNGTIEVPGSCETSNVNNRQMPYCFDMNVNVHNNAVTQNSALGDELFSATLTGAGGVAFCTGADYYLFNYNWVCGNVSAGEGGGLSHIGWIKNGDIEHNSIIFNQSTNPTIPTNGGGIMVMGAPDTDPVCSVEPDADCPPGLSDGTGPNLKINANLIQGNSAESGSGGGIRLQNINGAEIANFPNTPTEWYSVAITNNIISNNVAGWDGAGISLQDALNVNIVNNTIMSNDTTATSGVLFNTIGAPLASVAPPANVTTSTPQPAGLVSVPNTANLTASLPNTITCPVGHSSGSPFDPVLNIPVGISNGDCRKTSYPVLYNNVFWQNRAFNITVGGYQNQYQQNTISLVPVLQQPGVGAIGQNGTSGSMITGGTGACVSGANYWDVGVRGDTGPKDHSSGVTLSPIYSVLTDASGYANIAKSTLSANNTSNNPEARSQYCNGSRVPPEFGGMGYQVPPGIADATVPNPIFSLTPAATVDEGNNWVNMSWGPLSLLNPVTNATLGNYALSSTSPANNYIPTNNQFNAIYGFPKTDFFGNVRPAAKNPAKFDIGAVEFQGAAPATVEPSSLSFGNVAVGTSSTTRTVTLTAGDNAMTGISFTFSGPFAQPKGALGSCPAGTFNLGANRSCTINVVYTPTAAQSDTGTLTINAATALGSPVTLSGTGFTTPLIAAPASLTFGNTIVGATSAAQTLTLKGAAAGITLAITGPFTIAPSTAATACPATATFSLPLSNGSTTCTVGLVFQPTGSLGATSGSVAVSAQGVANVGGSPVALNGTAVGASVTPTALDFGQVVLGTTSLPQTITLSNTAGSALSITGVSLTQNVNAQQQPQAIFTRPSNNAGSCGATLAAGKTCTINVMFTPTANTAYTGYQIAVAGSYGGKTLTTVFNSPVQLTGTGFTPTIPTLTVIDNFNRANGNLGTNWNVLLNAIQISSNQAACPLCILGPGSGFWSASGFTTNEAAAFQITSTTLNGDAVLLGANGASLFSNWTNFIHAQISNSGATGTVRVEATVTGGLSYSTVQSVTTKTGAFQKGDIVTAELEGDDVVAAPTIYVWVTRGATCTDSKTAPTGTTCTGGTSTLIAAVQIPSFPASPLLPKGIPNTLWQNGGNVGMQVVRGGTVDNFAGGSVK